MVDPGGWSSLHIQLYIGKLNDLYRGWLVASSYVLQKHTVSIEILSYSWYLH